MDPSIWTEAEGAAFGTTSSSFLSPSWPFQKARAASVIRADPEGHCFQKAPQETDCVMQLDLIQYSIILFKIVLNSLQSYLKTFYMFKSQTFSILAQSNLIPSAPASEGKMSGWAAYDHTEQWQAPSRILCGTIECLGWGEKLGAWVLYLSRRDYRRRAKRIER